jgi:hypothetical protein
MSAADHSSMRSPSRRPFDVYGPSRRNGYFRDSWDAWFARRPSVVWAGHSPTLASRSSSQLAVAHPRRGFYVLGSRFPRPLPPVIPSSYYGVRLRLTFSSRLGVFGLESDEHPLAISFSSGEGGLMWAAYDVGREVALESTIKVEIIEPASPEITALGAPEWYVAHMWNK